MSEEPEEKEKEKQEWRRWIPKTGVLGAIIATAAVMTAVNYPTWRRFLIWAVILSVALCGLAILILYFLRRWDRLRRSNKMLDDLMGKFDAIFGSEPDPKIRARIEEMKRKFMVLIERLRKTQNTNIYQMPWFLTLGPSATGKS